VPFIQINPADMAELGLKTGDMVEVYNDVGATQAMVYPSPPHGGTRPSCCSARRTARRAT
jgi:anaerobic selenocysteine-containing dehydrogenase